MTVNLVPCRACGEQIAPDAKYCSECGVRLAASVLNDTAPPVSKRREALSATLPLDAPDSVPPPEHVADPLIGVTIAGRYRIIEPLGRGGMGVVYRVEHARIGKLMALKLLAGELSRDSEVVARFKREALMVSKLSHPNTVQVFDFGTSEGMTYLAMEYLRGEDLGRMIRRGGPLSAARASRVVIQVCSSLGEAHRLDIVHRDLKPENVFILQGQAGSDLVKVLDFGLAKLRESAELGEVTSRGAIVGTPYYMSPEQIRGEAADQRSDIYSLGALMYACLTGEPPFDAPRPMGVLTKHLVEAPINPCKRFPNLAIPTGLGAIVMRALEKDPQHRFQSVESLQESLLEELKREGASSAEILLDSGQMQALSHADSAAATRDEVERYETKLRRRGFVTWLGVLGAIAVTGVVGWRLVLQAQQEPSFTGAEREPNNSASEAMPVPFGASVRGQLGRRLGPDRSDRDFYRVEVPGDVSAARVALTPLPNMALCAWVYRVGIDSPLGTYCSGAPGLELEIPVLELASGSHYIAVMQDRDGYGGVPPHVLENISDAYTLTVERASPSSDQETEPNDSLKDANMLEGDALRGRLAWMRDVDVVCVPPERDTVRFVVEDSARRRSRLSVLQVTPVGGPADGIPVRVHVAPAAPDANDVASPWHGPTLEKTASGPRCLMLQLVPNPLEPGGLPRVAPAGKEEYVIRVQSP